MELNQVTLPCNNYEDSVDFYKLLGFRQIVDSPQQIVYLSRRRKQAISTLAG